MGYADVGADIYLALGLVAFYAAGAAPIAFVIAAVTYVCTGLAYAELASTYPYAGGAHIYAMKSFNDLVGFVAGWAVMLDYTVDIGLFAIATSGYLSYFLPFLRTGAMKLNLIGVTIAIPDLGVAAFLLVLGLLALNFIGIRESSFFNVVLVSLDLLVEATLIIFGVALAFSLPIFLQQLTIFGAPEAYTNISYFISQWSTSDQNFLYGVTIAMTSFIGIESIAQAAEETRRPYKWIPRASKLSIASVLVFALGLSILSNGMMPWTVLAENQADPLTALATRIPLIGAWLTPLVALTGFLICYVSTNTGVIGVSRVTFSMGKFNLMPRWFSKLHPNYRTPTRTILIFGLVGAAIAFVGELHFVADLYNFGALLSYIIVNVSLIILRNKEPEAYRAWKVPRSIRLKLGKRVIDIPVISVVGAISCAALWSLVLAFHEAGRLLGAVWLLIGIVGFIAFRRISRIPILNSQTAQKIVPGAYTMNAAVFVRTPDDEDTVVSSIRDSFDKRFRIRLMTILDPDELGLSLRRVRNYQQLKAYESESAGELESVATKLRHLGYQADVRVEIGRTQQVVREVVSSETNDIVALIKRRSLKGHFVKDSEDSMLAIVSEYPGKLMVIRRSE